MMIAGVDEVGLGCLAGPIISAAVILGDFKGKVIFKDSKKTSERNRHLQHNLIKQNCYYSIGVATPHEIDELNVLNASHLAMKRALKNLPVFPKKILIDGSHVPEGIQNADSVIKGDSLIQEISAASVFAKVFRDSLMKIYSEKYKFYSFQNNKGYPTPEHKNAISRYGLSEIHQKSFKI